MNKDNRMLEEAYKIIKEQDSSYSPVWKKIAWNLGIDPGNLTKDQVDRLIYDQKPRDISFGGFQALKDHENSNSDKTYDNYATILPYSNSNSDDRSPEKIRLDYLRRLDGLQPGDPLSYYNTKNPNWFYAAYNDERNKEGPFSPDWNYDKLYSIWNNGYNTNNTPLSFNNIYKNPYGDKNQGNSLGAISNMVGLVNSIGNQMQKPAIRAQNFNTITNPAQQAVSQKNSAVSDYVNKFKQNMESVD